MPNFKPIGVPLYVGGSWPLHPAAAVDRPPPFADYTDLFHRPRLTQQLLRLREREVSAGGEVRRCEWYVDVGRNSDGVDDLPVSDGR
jgi:hypothetical protein